MNSMNSLKINVTLEPVKVVIQGRFWECETSVLRISDVSLKSETVL